MSVPKKFNETINLKKRFESLNELLFFVVKYDYTLVDGYKDRLHEEFDKDFDLEITGVKEFHALNEEQALSKIENWFMVLTDKKILESSEVTSIETKTLKETLKDKQLLDLLYNDL
jgi:hypothetical protein